MHTLKIKVQFSGFAFDRLSKA